MIQFQHKSAEKTIFFKYDDLEDFLSDTAEVNPLRAHDSSDKVRDNNWAGSKTYGEAVEISRHGFGMDKIEMEIAGIESTENVRMMEVQMDVTGSVVEMGAFLSGIPENMMSFPIVEDIKFAHVVMDIGEIADTSEVVLMNKCIATATLVDRLEANGYRVKIDVYYHNAMQHGLQIKHSVLINVKEYKEPLSLGQLSGSLHASFFRRLMFRHMEKYYGQDLPSGYGTIKSRPEIVKRDLQLMCDDEEVIFLPNYSDQSKFGESFNLNNLKEAQKWAHYFATTNIIKLR